MRVAMLAQQTNQAPAAKKQRIDAAGPSTAAAAAEGEKMVELEEEDAHEVGLTC
jgi:high-affinity K+ transport system ATPase subunit B